MYSNAKCKNKFQKQLGKIVDEFNLNVKPEIYFIKFRGLKKFFRKATYLLLDVIKEIMN